MLVRSVVLLCSSSSPLSLFPFLSVVSFAPQVFDKGLLPRLDGLLSHDAVYLFAVQNTTVNIFILKNIDPMVNPMK